MAVELKHGVADDRAIRKVLLSVSARAAKHTRSVDTLHPVLGYRALDHDAKGNGRKKP